jgi:hypothetical protein
MMVYENKTITDIHNQKRKMHVPYQQSSSDAVCAWTFQTYIPSPWEMAWVDNVSQLQDRVCDESNNAVDRIEEWVSISLKNVNAPPPAFPLETFSQFIFQNNCTGAVSVDYVEPLAGLTRHPYFCLKGRDWIVNKDYMIVSWNASKKLTGTKPGKAKSYYFDLGASDWDSGAGGASQSWFVTNYEQRGITWDGIFCWEAAPMDTTSVWSKIPAHLKPIYHWYNIQVSAEHGHSDNALNYIRGVARPEDFVVLKIDIDNTPVESSLIDQLLASDDLLQLVDELFFEHHVNVAPMHDSWWTQNEKTTLADTYKIFSTLRSKGIIAHSWV